MFQRLTGVDERYREESEEVDARQEEQQGLVHACHQLEMRLCFEAAHFLVEITVF